MTEPVNFLCPGCGLKCQLSPQQRAVRHEVPDCAVWAAHKRKGDIQEFLRIALMKAGGAAINLGDVTIDVAPQFTEQEKAELTDILVEGLKKV